MNIDIQYVWLSGSLGFFVIWLVVFILAEKGSKKEMFTISLITSLFGLLAQLFIRRYWDPPTFLAVIHNVGFSIENIIFSFSLGGVFFESYKAIFKFWKKGMVIRLLSGGIISTGICFIFFAAFTWAFSGYLDQAWTFRMISGTKILGVPLSGLFFFFILGVIWAECYELYKLRNGKRNI